MIMLADTDSDYVVIRITGKFTLGIYRSGKSFPKTIKRGNDQLQLKLEKYKYPEKIIMLL